MTRVCHMTSAHSSNDTRIFYKECVSLAKAGYEVFLVAPGMSREEMGVNVVGIGEAHVSRLRRMTQTSRKVYQKALSLNADIYHLHDPELLPFGMELKKRSKMVIFDSHEDVLNYIEEKSWIPSFFRKPVAYLSKKYFCSVLPKFDALVSVTPHLHEELININPQTHMITNYPIIKDDKKTTHPAYDGQNFILLFVGGVTPQWNHEIIVQSIQQIERVSYHVYGECNSDYLHKLQSIDKAGRFVYHGAVSHEEVRNVMKFSTVGMALCQYSLNSGGKRGTLGNTKLFEYLEASLPVICTDFELWQEIITEYKCGVCVEPNDIVAISNAINFFLKNPKETESMGQKGWAAVKECYNWEEEEKHLLNLYDQILEGC